jgi:putative component of membrane protein insertase Oxa1/YidC/SpoIIIJ protein YidD
MRPQGQPQGLTATLIRRIERYRSSSPLTNHDVCRFTPSCSHYAEELLRSRRLPVALPLIVWRLLRCNPFMGQVADDPVRRPRRRLRPNTLPTVFSVVALSGLVVVMTAATAEAVGVSNGCSATINGRSPSTLTKDDPLAVHKGETVSVTGSAPAGTPAKDTNNTHIDVAIIDGVFGVSSSDHPGHGPSWGGSQNVDDYLKYGVGLYHVTGVANGSSGWHCEGDGYVELKDGSPLTKPIGAGAAGLAIIGGIGALLSARSRFDTDAEGVAARPRDPEEELRDDIGSIARAPEPAPGTEAAISFGCLVGIAIMAFLGLLEGGAMFAAASAPAVEGSPRKRRVWAHGHPVAGFISGLIAGIGIAVLLQQFALWPLTIVTAIVFPVVVAVLCALRAYLGRPYTVESA